MTVPTEVRNARITIAKYEYEKLAGLLCADCGHHKSEHNPLTRCQDGWCDCVYFVKDPTQ